MIQVNRCKSDRLCVYTFVSAFFPMISVSLAVLAHPAMAAEHSGRLLARVCAGDFERLCAKQVPVPAIEDFRDGGLINQCLKGKISQLSNPCWYAIMQGGR